MRLAAGACPPHAAHLALRLALTLRLRLRLRLRLTLSLTLSLSLTLTSWAHSMVQSRAFSVPSEEEGGETRWALVPRRAHSSGSHIYSVAAIALAGGVERLWEVGRL